MTEHAPAVVLPPGPNEVTTGKKKFAAPPVKSACLAWYVLSPSPSNHCVCRRAVHYCLPLAPCGWKLTMAGNKAALREPDVMAPSRARLYVAKSPFCGDLSSLGFVSSAKAEPETASTLRVEEGGLGAGRRPGGPATPAPKSRRPGRSPMMCTPCFLKNQ